MAIHPIIGMIVDEQDLINQMTNGDPRQCLVAAWGLNYMYGVH